MKLPLDVLLVPTLSVRVAGLLFLGPALVVGAALLRPEPPPAPPAPPPRELVVEAWPAVMPHGLRPAVMSELVDVQAPLLTANPRVVVTGEVSHCSREATLRLETGAEERIVPARTGPFLFEVQLPDMVGGHQLRVTLHEWNGEATTVERRVEYRRPAGQTDVDRKVERCLAREER